MSSIKPKTMKTYNMQDNLSIALLIVWYRKNQFTLIAL